MAGSSPEVRAEAEATLWSPCPATEDGWMPPVGPPPRERYEVRTERRDASSFGPLHVTVVRRATETEAETVVAEYDRNYAAFFSTFEPFRQGGRDYALISRRYTTTSVLDLQTGQMVAEEPPAKFGFCPQEFWVPDWREVHDEPPYTEVYSAVDVQQQADLQWPRGDFGFVAGCVWGDDYLEKLQFLDLSRISEGIITRDERFDYLRLPPAVKLRDAVELDTETGQVMVATYLGYNVATGQAQS